MNRYYVAVGGNEICTLRSILSTSNPSLAILIGNPCLCIFTFLFPLWMSFSLSHRKQTVVAFNKVSYMGLVEEVAALGMFVYKTDYPISSQKLCPSMGRKCFLQIACSFLTLVCGKIKYARWDIHGRCVCVCDINDVYAISEVLNNFVSLATQRVTYGHLKGKEKMGRGVSTI